MTKEELIIDEKYHKISSGNVGQLYLNLYSDKAEDDSKKKYYMFLPYIIGL